MILLNNEKILNGGYKRNLTQLCEFFVERGVLGVTKEIEHLVLEYKGEQVNSNDKSEASSCLRVPSLPTTMVGVCRLVQIYYTLTVSVLFIISIL